MFQIVCYLKLFALLLGSFGLFLVFFDQYDKKKVSNPSD